MSARDQLDRILYVLAEASRTGGARIEDVARTLEVEPSTILADIEEATARVFYQPAGSVDAFDLSVDGDVVCMYASNDFKRPVRLNQPEAMALSLGLRVLAAEAEDSRRAEILALAERLEDELVVPDLELQPASRVSRNGTASDTAVELDMSTDDFRGVLADAIESRCWCSVKYLRASAPEPTARRIAPLRLLYSRGHWYVWALDTNADYPRLYRLDRVLSIDGTTDSHDHAADAFPINSAFNAAATRSIAVRYAPSVARWLAEREGKQCEADGTLVLTHDVADTNWLVRHVLQYSGEAVVDNPELRREVVDAVKELCA